MKTRITGLFGIQHLIIQGAMHFLGFPLMLVCALLASCDTPEASHGEPGGPVETAVKFYEAAQAWRCDEVWRTYTAGTQENIRAEMHRYERERDGEPWPDPLEKRYCGRLATLKRGSARIVRQQGDEAVVAAEFNVRVVSDRNFFAHSVVRTEELRLVREAGAWRVERPRVPIGRPGSRLTEVGPVDVFHPENAHLFRDLVHRLEATVVARASRERLESALRDPKFWAHVLPSVNAVEPLERTGERERVRLSFAEPDRSLTVAVNQLWGKPVDPAMPVTTLQWAAEGGNKAPIYFLGSWELKPHHDGTRVTLHLRIIPKEWPGGVAEGSFSAQRMAQAVLDLENAALK